MHDDGDLFIGVFRWFFYVRILFKNVRPHTKNGESSRMRAFH